MSTTSETNNNSQNIVTPQTLYDRSRVSGLELFKQLTTLATAAVGVFFIAISTNVRPPLTSDQRTTVLAALFFMTFTLMCGIVGIAVDSYFYESWARFLSGKDPQSSWKRRERANLLRKIFAFAAMISFFCGVLLAGLYIHLRATASAMIP